jgi:hypothetical protein
MKRIKLFEDFKNNNEDGTLITEDDIIKCIEMGGSIYSTIVKDFPDNDPKQPLRPVDIDEDGLITVDFDGNLYTVKLKDVERLEY